MKQAVLVVAGLDPSGGAGLLADAAAIRAGGARPLCCASAITIQTTRAVRGFHALPAEVVAAQVEALAEEEGPIGAVKLGMLGAAATATALARLRDHPALRRAAWVVDPVLRSSSGAALIDGGAAAYEPLLAGISVITPNLAEAAELARLPLPADEAAMEHAGRALLARGVGAALVTGGHLAGEAIDLLVRPEGAIAHRAPRLAVSRRGTGCRFASFLAARLAAGDDLSAAAAAAKRFVAAYLSDAANAPR